MVEQPGHILSTAPGLPPSAYSNFGGFISSSCTGTGGTAICIAGGLYHATNGTDYPMLALSTNGGATWSYPVDSSGLLPSDYSNNGEFKSLSCTGTGGTAICIAGGNYQATNSNYYPMLALSTNGGTSWSYVIDGNSVKIPFRLISLLISAAMDSM